MAETKPFASLSSGLLARKGGAKPAMRPQGFGSFGGSLEDLGWNDMGTHETYEHVPTPIDALTPCRPAPVEAEPEAEPEAYEPPPVVEQQRALKKSFEPAPAPEPAPRAEVVALPRPRALPGKAKAAFTLRLDPDRHLKLRLACALNGRSAQQLVTEALDEYLASRPEVEALAERVPAAGKSRR
ncbi:MAG: hypothetical protein QOH04_2768 [Sphingomonadales bacterium]|jgi:hypothetical protein|nr:hypothetical protein [Sphingomonadales bacterium]MEA3036991.1 hypothetical protein [Sphingomonadales bacterium]